MSEVKWYARGEIGERVLDIIEDLASTKDDYVKAACVGRLIELGMSIQEIDDLLLEEELL